MKKLVFTLSALSIAGIAFAQVSYRSAGGGTADLGSASNWQKAPSPAGPWSAATAAPGSDASLSAGSVIIINEKDQWVNTLTTKFPAGNISGVTIIDNSTVATTEKPEKALITSSAQGNKVIFAGDNIPVNTFFSGNTIKYKVEIRGNIATASSGTYFTFAAKDSALILASGIFTSNVGNSSLYLGGPIYSKGGYNTNSSFVVFNGTSAVTLPANVFCNPKGEINNQIMKLTVKNHGAGVTTTGPLSTPCLNLTDGNLTLGGTLTVGGGYGTNYTLIVEKGCVVPGKDTVVFRPQARNNEQTVPAGFFQDNTAGHLRLNNTDGVTYSAPLTVSQSLTVDVLGKKTPLNVSGDAKIGGALIISKFQKKPSGLPATYTIVSATGTVNGAFSSVSVPVGYKGEVTVSGNSATLTITRQ